MFAEHADEIGPDAKVHVVPPGIDQALFAIGVGRREERAFLSAVARRLGEDEGGRRPRGAVDATGQTPEELERWPPPGRWLIGGSAA